MISSPENSECPMRGNPGSRRCLNGEGGLYEGALPLVEGGTKLSLTVRSAIATLLTEAAFRRDYDLVVCSGISFGYHLERSRHIARPSKRKTSRGAGFLQMV